MHEFSIATQLLDQVLLNARRHQARAVTRVTLDVGVMQQVVPEAMHAAFEAAAADTLADGAELVLNEVPACARCNSCGHEFTPAIDNYVCEACGQADVTITGGNQITLTSMECTTDEDDES